jgi:hypothetical protein
VDFVFAIPRFEHWLFEFYRREIEKNRNGAGPAVHGPAQASNGDVDAAYD